MKIGLDQLNVPAPLFYRRLVNALIVIVMPAAGATIAQLPPDIISDKGKILCGVVASFVTALLKGAEYILGEGGDSGANSYNHIENTEPPK